MISGSPSASSIGLQVPDEKSRTDTDCCGDTSSVKLEVGAALGSKVFRSVVLCDSADRL